MPRFALFLTNARRPVPSGGIIPFSTCSTSTPAPDWLAPGATICRPGIYVLYYTVEFPFPAASALYQNRFEIPATHAVGRENSGCVILSVTGEMKNRITLRTDAHSLKSARLLLAEVPFL